MPYGPRQSDDNVGECSGNGNDNSPSSSYGAPSTGYGAPSSGYGNPAAPAVNNNNNAYDVVADMQAPLPPAPQAPPAIYIYIVNIFRIITISININVLYGDTVDKFDYND